MTHEAGNITGSVYLIIDNDGESELFTTLFTLDAWLKIACLEFPRLIQLTGEGNGKYSKKELPLVSVPHGEDFGMWQRVQPSRMRSVDIPDTAVYAILNSHVITFLDTCQEIVMSIYKEMDEAKFDRVTKEVSKLPSLKLFVLPEGE